MKVAAQGTKRAVNDQGNNLRYECFVNGVWLGSDVGFAPHQLLAHGLLQRVAGAADQQRRVEAQRPQHRDGVLRRLRLLLAHGAQHRHQLTCTTQKLLAPTRNWNCRSACTLLVSTFQMAIKSFMARIN